MSDEKMTLHTPVEGDGHYASKALQWVDLCPHIGAPEKTLLRVLTNLTTRESPTRRIAPAELRSMVYTGPVAVGEEPKLISASGLRRLLRSLATLGQITDPEGRPLTFSSGAGAQLRGVSMAIWRYPRHDCGCARNAFDALAITRGEQPRFGPTSTDPTATWPELPPDQVGQEVDQVGQEVDQVGQEVDQVGQEVDQDTQRDQQKRRSPSTSSSTSSSSSSSRGPGSAETTSPTRPTKEEEEESPSAEKTNSESAVDVVVRRTDATEEEAQAVLDELLESARRRGTPVGSPSLYVDRFRLEDLTHRLWQLRRQRASEARTGASGGAVGGPECSEHYTPLPCRVCERDVRLIGDLDVARRLLAEQGPMARPDLAELLAATA